MNEAKATRYQRLRRRAHAADVLCGAALLAGLALTPAAHGLAQWARAVGRRAPWPLGGGLAVAGFLGVLILLWEAVSLPAVLYLWFWVDRRFKAATDSLSRVLIAQGQATAAGSAAAVVAAVVVLAATRLAGPLWWLLAGVLLAASLLGALRAMPAVLLRVARTRAVNRPSLMAGLRELARETGVHVSDIVEWQVDDQASALVAGLGRTRRVFVSSEMLRDWADDENRRRGGPRTGPLHASRSVADRGARRRDAVGRAVGRRPGGLGLLPAPRASRAG